MGLWGRLQVNGALLRLSKRIAARPYLWEFASDNRPHFDHWVEEHASDGDLVRALRELEAALSEIPLRYLAREWGYELSSIIRGSIECVRREMQKRGLMQSEAADPELDRPEADAFVSTDRAEPLADAKRLHLDKARAPIVKLFHDTLTRQQSMFAGQVDSADDERGVRLNALLHATFELVESHVPGMDVVLKDPGNRRNMVMNLTMEYMPILMLDPGELPRAFAEYMLWKYGTDQALEQIVDIDYLKGVFQRGISLLPDETRAATISLKHRFEWGKLV